MLLFFKLALRNLIRNRVRTFLNLLMIISAFSAIVIFRGFAHYMLHTVEVSFTEGQNGHIQIAMPAIWNDDLPKHKEDAYIENHTEIEENLLSVTGIKLASGRSNSYVLLINGDKSVGAQALGFDPKLEPNIEKALTITEGEGFSKELKFEILVGAGLQRALQLKIGQTISIVSQTLIGSMSSLDLEVKGVVKTGFADLDNSTVYLPLGVAQRLLGTVRVERIAILLKKGASLEDSLAKVKEILKNHSQLQAKSWKESATFFRQLTDFYKVQNRLVEIILSCLVFFGILNTLGMSIYERIGEIGTLRALGDHSEAVLFQLVLEGLLLGLIGALFATPIASLISFGFSSLELPILMPGASQTMPIHIEPVGVDYLISGAVVGLTCFVASLWPAQRAIRLSIVDALRANS